MKARAAKLGLIADFINGYPFKPHQLGTVGQPVVRIRQLMDPSASVDYSTIQVPVENQIKDGDLIFAWSGSLAVKKWTRGPALLNQHLFKVVPHAGVDLDFLGYALEEVIPRLHAHGSTMQHVTRPELLSTQIQLPGLDQQRNIVDYLDREIAEMDAMNADLDTLIEMLRERLKRAIKSVGGQLLDLASPRRTSLKYLLSKQQRPIQSEDGVVTAFRDGEVTLRSARREEGFTMSAQEDGYQGVEPGDFVFHGLDGFAGAVGVSDSRGKASPVYHVCTANEHTTTEFMAWALRSMVAVGYIEAHAWSVRQRSVDFRNWATFSALPIALPPLEEQRRIVDELDSATTRIDAMIADAERLKALLAERKSTLITEVVTGRKEVPAA